jgi:hypothetical protein
MSTGEEKFAGKLIDLRALLKARESLTEAVPFIAGIFPINRQSDVQRIDLLFRISGNQDDLYGAVYPFHKVKGEPNGMVNVATKTIPSKNQYKAETQICLSHTTIMIIVQHDEIRTETLI